MGDLRVKIKYLPKTGIINNIAMPSRKEEFSGTSSDLFIPSIGQQFFQLSDNNNPENASYGLEEGVFWRGTSAEKYNGFVSFSKSNKDKIFETASDVTITFSGSNITGFVIYFDNVAKQWATELTVNGVTYANDDSMFVWGGDSTNSITIVLKKWNRANVSARITSVSVGLEIEYTKDAFTLVERGMQTIDDNSTLSWGVLGQYGSIRIIDTDTEIQDMASVGILKSGIRLPAVFTLDSNQVASLIINKANYEFGNNVVDFELVSNVEVLDKVIYNGYAPQENKTNIEVFNELKALTVRNGIVVKFFDASTSTYLNRIGQRFLSMEQSNLREAWNRFCNDTSTRFYFNEYAEMILIEHV